MKKNTKKIFWCFTKLSLVNSHKLFVMTWVKLLECQVWLYCIQFIELTLVRHFVRIHMRQLSFVLPSQLRIYFFCLFNNLLVSTSLAAVAASLLRLSDTASSKITRPQLKQTVSFVFLFVSAVSFARFLQESQRDSDLRLALRRLKLHLHFNLKISSFSIKR